MRTDATPRSCAEGKVGKLRNAFSVVAHKTFGIEPLCFGKPPFIPMGYIGKRIYNAALWNFVSSQLHSLFGFSGKYSNRWWVEPECFLDDRIQVRKLRYVSESGRIVLENSLYLVLDPLLY